VLLRALRFRDARIAAYVLRNAQPARYGPG
jgi:hypothetical protein